MSKLYMIDVEYFMVAAAFFLTLYCIVLKRDPEPFQSIINKHKRNARKAYEKGKNYIYTNIKPKPKIDGF